MVIWPLSPTSSLAEKHLRYRDINDLRDFSGDVALVVDFLGEAEYRSALEKLGRSLRAKGFVTPHDDLVFR